ncbi:hypothetical protein BJ170DRAFT_678709 [Xylariales sp. AK1849]|nr:hypothetical protein BJ170DRAFT_678709 [Xylariales sp. AK1849]
MAAVAPPGPPAAPVAPSSFRQFEAMPLELRIMVYTHYRASHPVTHHLFIVHHDGYTATGQPHLTRAYTAVDPTHRVLTRNSSQTVSALDVIGVAPGSGPINGTQILAHKIQLPSKTRVRTANTTYESRFDGLLYGGAAGQLNYDFERRQPVRVYVNFFRDVFYFHNELSYTRAMLHYTHNRPGGDLTNELHFFANPINYHLWKTPTLAPTYNAWTSRIRKLAVRIPDATTISYPLWLAAHRVFIQNNMPILTNLYFVVDCQDTACTLFRGVAQLPSIRNRVTKRDGFRLYSTWLFDHRVAIMGGHVCACRLPDVPAAAVGGGPAIVDHAHRTRLITDLTRGWQQNRWSGFIDVKFVVDLI